MPERHNRWEGDDGHFLLHFPASTDALANARHNFSEWLERCHVAPDVAGELATAFSELATNAIQATTDTASTALARAWQDGRGLVLEVVNPTPGSARPTQRWDFQDQLRTGGRGLQIVRAFTDTVEVDEDELGRLIVRCRRSLSDDT